MYPRVPSPAAQRGQSPVASIGRRLGEAVQDPADFPTDPHAPTAEVAGKRVPRKPLDNPLEGESAQPAQQPLKDQGDAIDAIE